MNGIFLVLASFLASAIESIEMMAIVVGVGAARGWRSALLGAFAGLAILGIIIFAMGTALQAVPVHWLRLVVGTLLLIFGLQWLKKGIVRIARPKPKKAKSDETAPTPDSAAAIDWYSFVVSFKGVLLEGLEIAFIVVTFGAAAHQVGLATIGATAAFLFIAGIAFLIRSWLARLPREWLRFAVGVLLTTFGVFWAAEGAGVDWPGDELSLLALLGVMLAISFAFLARLRRGRVEGKQEPVAAESRS